MRPTVRVCVATAFGLAVYGGAGPAFAAGPNPVNVHISTHQAVEFDPNFLFDASPCFVTRGDLTEVFNAEGHALAAGIDGQGNFLPPLHVQQTVEESILFVPKDRTLPTYAGHATVHTTNVEDSPNAGFTNNVILRGSDGSQLIFHENVHVLVKPSGNVLSVDHKQARC
jgi:hypothetical protein